MKAIFVLPTVKPIVLFFFLLLPLDALLAQPISDHEFAQKFQLARVYEETRDITNAIRVYSELHKARPQSVEISEGLF